MNKGFYMEPTVLGRVPDDALVMNEEPFGPIAPITTFTDYDDVMTRANSLPFGLAGYIFSNNLSLATRAYEDLEVGMVGVNEMLLATAEALVSCRSPRARPSAVATADETASLVCTSERSTNQAP